jgi:hypothetical protein
MADYSLALNVKPLQLEDPLTSYGRFATIQSAQNQNALAQYQLAAAQRAEEQQNALYQQAQMPGFKLDFGTALGFGAPGIAAFKAQREAETQGLQAQELRGKIAAQPVAKAEMEAKTNRYNEQVRESQTKALGLGLMQAMQNPDDNTLKSVFDRLDATGIDTKTYRDQFAAIPDIAARKQIIEQYALANPEGRQALEFVSPKPQTFNLGGKEVSYDMNPNSPTYKQEILSQAKGLTPGEAKPTISQVDVGDRVLTQSYDPGTGKITVLETRNKGASPQGMPSDVQSYEYAKNQGYTGTYTQWVKDKATWGRAPAQPPAPAPLERAFDTKTNSQVFVDRSQIRADPERYKPLGAEEKLKNIPETINKGLTGNVASISQIDRAIDAVTKNPNAVGLRGNFPQTILNRADPAGVEARALVTDVGSAKVHDRSGAAVAASEAPRLMPFIPQATDDAATVVKKLKQLKTQIEIEQSGILDFYSQEQGYRPSLYHKQQKVTTEPAASAAAPVSAGTASNIPQAAIDFLKQGRGTRADFDAQFGPGSAKRVLGN